MYNYIEPKYEDTLQQLQAESLQGLAELATPFLAEVKIPEKLATQEDYLEYIEVFERIGDTIFDNPEIIPETATHFQQKYVELHRTFTKLRNLKSFDIHSYRAQSIVDEQATTDQLFQMLLNFNHNTFVYYKSAAKEKPIKRKSFGQFHVYRMSDVNNTFKQMFEMTSTPVLKKFLKFARLNKIKGAREIKGVKEPNHEWMESYTIEKKIFEGIMRSYKKKFSAAEYRMLNTALHTNLEKGEVAFLLMDPPITNEEKLVNFKDEILENLYFQIWVKSKIEQDLEGVTQATTEEKKIYNELKKESVDYYSQAFYEIPTPWQKDMEESETLLVQDDELAEDLTEEGDTAPMQTEKPTVEISHSGSPVSLETLENTKYNTEYTSQEPVLEVKDLLKKRRYLKYIQSVSAQMQRKVEKILQFSLHNQELCQKGFGHVTRHMQGELLPWINCQQCAMKFNGTNYPSALKLNVTDGDRFLFYVKTDGSIGATFMTAAEYHKHRKK